jgi:branched-chain amino acid transport system permease protein
MGRFRTYLLFGAAIVVPLIFSNGGFVNFLADAGAFVLLALGLNIVIGFAGLLDLGYAAFFAIGSYTFAMLASPQFGIHIPFWIMLFVA